MPQNGERSVSFTRVLYVTNESTDQWFQPGGATSAGTAQTNENGDDIQFDNVDNGTMAQRLAHCQNQVGCTDDSNASTTQIGVAVRPGTLNAW